MSLYKFTVILGGNIITRNEIQNYEKYSDGKNRVGKKDKKEQQKAHTELKIKQFYIYSR